MNLQFKTNIIAAGAAIPTKSVKSDDLLKTVDSEHRFGVPHNYISNKIGIIERRIADKLTKPSDLAIEASINALSKCGVDPMDIDVIIFCGIDRDWAEPSTAHRVQYVLGAKNAFCFDITNACHGMMNGLDYANEKIQNGKIETALICTGERSSDLLYDVMNKLSKPGTTRSDFEKWVGTLTVGDAGGAFITKKSDDGTGIEYMQFYSAGEYADLCCYTRNEYGIEGHMHMAPISKKFTQMHKKHIKAVYKSTGWAPHNIDHLICHQVGATPHNIMCKIAKVPLHQAACTYPLLGNITSATIPVALALTPHKRNDKILIQSGGSGLITGSTGMICNYDNSIDPIHSTLNYSDYFKTADSA